MHGSARYYAMQHALPGADIREVLGAEESADLFCQVSDLRILGLGLGLFSSELGAEVVLIAQQAFTGLLQEVLLLLQLAQLHSHLCLQVKGCHGQGELGAPSAFLRKLLLNLWINVRRMWL